MFTTETAPTTLFGITPESIEECAFVQAVADGIRQDLKSLRLWGRREVVLYVSDGEHIIDTERTPRLSHCLLDLTSANETERARMLAIVQEQLQLAIASRAREIVCNATLEYLPDCIGRDNIAHPMHMLRLTFARAPKR